MFEACGGNTQIEVPCPPPKPIIQSLDLLATAYSRQVEKSNDKPYRDSTETFTKVINICDETQSHRRGAQARISLSRLLLRWDKAATVKDKVASLLDPVLTYEVNSKFTDLSEQAKNFQIFIFVSPPKKGLPGFFPHNPGCCLSHSRPKKDNAVFTHTHKIRLKGAGGERGF